MATYNTDMVVLASGSDAEAEANWQQEFTDWSSGSLGGDEGENFIQGSQSISQTFGNAVTGKSICFDAQANIASSIPTGDVVMAWVFMGAATNMYPYASGGHRFGIGASVDDFDMWYISGDDRPPNPYGGWWNVAIDPRHTPDAIDEGATGSGGVWQYFGSLIGDTTLGIRVKISKGAPHAMDGMRMGRGEIYCTGAGATFTLMAADNDLVANRWGLLQDTGGGAFLWKGLMSFGQVGTAVTFSDSNKSIIIDDTAKTYPGFNLIEFNHTDTDVTLNNISFAARGTYAPGWLEMIADCTVVMNGCTFNGFGTSIFLSGATLTGVAYNTSGQVTQGGATFDTCAFNESTAAIALIVDDLSLVSDCTFTSDGTGHAIDLGTFPTTDSVNWDNYAVGYVAGATGSPITPGTSGNETILCNVGSGEVLTINVGSGYTTPSVKNDGPGTVWVVAGQINYTIKLVDEDGATVTESTEVTVVKDSDVSVLYHAENVTTGSTVYTFDGGLSGTDIYINVLNVAGYEPVTVAGITLPVVDSTITIQMRADRFYNT